MLGRHSFKKNLALFWLLMKIQTIYWFTNYLNLISGLGVSLFMLICWLAFKQGDPFLLVSGISVGILRNGMIIYTTNLMDWKLTKTDRRLETTPISTGLKAFSALFFNFLTTTLVALIMFAIAMAFFPDQRQLVGNANITIVLTGLLLVWLTSIATALFCFEFIKSLVASKMVLLVLYVLSLYLLGLGFPIQRILAPDNAWLGYLLYLMPHRFAMNLAQAGYANYHGADGTSSILIIKDMPIYNSHGEEINRLSVDFGYQGHLWLAYLCALAVLVFYFGLAFLKLVNRLNQYKRNTAGQLITNQNSLNYLRRLRRAKTISEINLIHKIRTQELQERSADFERVVAQVQRETRTLERLKLGKKQKK